MTDKLTQYAVTELLARGAEFAERVAKEVLPGPKHPNDAQGSRPGLRFEWIEEPGSPAMVQSHFIETSNYALSSTRPMVDISAIGSNVRAMMPGGPTEYYVDFAAHNVQDISVLRRISAARNRVNLTIFGVTGMSLIGYFTTWEIGQDINGFTGRFQFRGYSER